MNGSLTDSGTTIADLSLVVVFRPRASKLTDGLAFTSVRRLRATQPDRPSPSLSVMFSSCVTSRPAAYRHFRASPSAVDRKSAHPDHGMIFESFDETSAIVSATPRLVPIDCAISYSA